LFNYISFHHCLFNYASFQPILISFLTACSITLVFGWLVQLHQFWDWLFNYISFQMACSIASIFCLFNYISFPDCLFTYVCILELVIIRPGISSHSMNCFGLIEQTDKACLLAWGKDAASDWDIHFPSAMSDIIHIFQCIDLLNKLD
jgi:hypothetical protein